jgi:NAD(P)H-flavin reductase
MSRYLQSKCIDINSAYCPCILASSNHCVFCAHLQGKDICDCNWSGVCILYERKWNARNDVLIAKEPRPEIECAIIELKYINDNVFSIVLAVPSEMAAQLKDPGSYVFIRRSVDPPYFHLPIGVMQVMGEDRIMLVIKALGPKSIRIAEEDQTLVIRGPYKNGIFGLPWLEKLVYGNVLLIAGGMGQPPALPVAEKLINNYNRVTAIIAPGVAGYLNIEEKMEALGVELIKAESLRRAGYVDFARKLAEDTWDLIVSCGPDVQHFAVMDHMREAGYDLPMAVTNNNIMCCGEGICGSCIKETVDHQSVRTCKTQLDIADLKRL